MKHSLLHPEIHPLHPDVLKHMRALAEEDRYHGATWETTTTFCDEVELQLKKIEELERRIKDGSKTHKQERLSCDDQSRS